MGGAFTFVAAFAGSLTLAAAATLTLVHLVPSSRRRSFTAGALIVGTWVSAIGSIWLAIGSPAFFKMAIVTVGSAPAISIAAAVGLGLIALASKGDA